MKLNDYLKQAREHHQAIGHFNFATPDVLRAIVQGAKEGGAPAVMVGTSEGEADFLGLKEAVALVKIIREEMDFPVFLNADHFKSFEKCKEAIDAGYDTVLIDASKLPYGENIALTGKVREYGKGIPVEGELGYLRGSSEIQEKVEITPDDYTKPEEAKDFVEKTGVDRLAVVFGNIHGIVMKQEENLDVEHLKKIIAAIPAVALVLHGASGLSDDQVSAAIKAGIVNVHFNTELRVAYTKGIEKALHSGEMKSFDSAQDHNVHNIVTTPYKYLGPAAEEVKKLVTEKVRLFAR
ncbi:MAG: class II fructose-bisphosphate aldolase [Candidatus Yanofskybacteria bacterium]|nr:class II fructose-bisphosphate aldolase [Candidatus Yanofskybacteria bacterium]